MIKSTAFALSLSIFFTTFGPAISHAEPKTPCHDYLKAIVKLADEVWVSEREQKRKLEIKLEATTASNQIKHWGDVENSIDLERIMLYLDSGERDKIGAILKPKHREIVFRLREMGRLAQALVENPTAISLIKEYQTHSVAFGKVYDQYKTHLNLLISVAEGKGIHNLYGKIPRIRSQQFGNYIIYDLTSPLARETAKMALSTIDAFEDAFYANSENASIVTKAKNFSRDLRVVFRGGLSPINGVFEFRVEQIKKRNTLMLRMGKHVSYAYLKALSFSRVPDRYKKYVMMIAALSYDRLILERYLGNIQEVTEITRGVSEKGMLVNVSDPVLVEKQLRLLLDLNASGLDDELLVTFARIPHFKGVWANLMKMAHDMSQGAQGYTQSYTKLYERMQHAEGEAHKMGDLSYIFEAPLGRHMASVIVTGSYVLLTSDFMLKWASDYRIWEVFEWARNGFPLN